MKTYTTKKTANSKAGGQITVCLFWIALWQCMALALGNALILPSPLQTAAALLELAIDRDFYLNISYTMLRCLSAMILSFAAGAAAAWCACKKSYIRTLLTLPVAFFKAVPVMAIIIYVILLATSDWVAIIVCFLMCFPVVYTNILEGLDSMPAELIELAKVYRLTDWQTVRYIYVPGIRTQIKAAVRLIAGLSWKAVVAAEVLSIPRFSLGYEMLNAKYYLETPRLFAYILTIVVLSLVMEKIINTCLSRIEEKGYEGSRLFPDKAERGISESELPLDDSAAFDLSPQERKGPAVTVCGVCKAYEDKSVLDDLNVEFEASKITALMGPSGRGKTTLARIIAGLETEYSGSVRFDKGYKLAYLFQEDRLVPWLNIYDNLALGLLGEDKSPNSDTIFKMAQDLEIEDVLWKLPEELSGGMKHRAALGRAFLPESSLMILDEPFRGLDEDLKDRITGRLWKRQTQGRTVILITHDSKDAGKLADISISFAAGD